jgi:hypothetical protein
MLAIPFSDFQIVKDFEKSYDITRFMSISLIEICRKSVYNRFEEAVVGFVCFENIASALGAYACCMCIHDKTSMIRGLAAPALAIIS